MENPRAHAKANIKRKRLREKSVRLKRAGSAISACFGYHFGGISVLSMGKRCAPFGVIVVLYLYESMN